MRKEQEFPVYLFHQGQAASTYELLGAHQGTAAGHEGFFFRVFAPHAQQVFVYGDFNDWVWDDYPMKRLNSQGLWETFVPGAEKGQRYKYRIRSGCGEMLEKADPYAFHTETRPGTASVLWPLGEYEWKDQAWQEELAGKEPYDRPMNIYEVHLGSWRRYSDGNFFSYRKLAEELPSYVKEMGYTHIEIMPVTEYPYDESWGYQVAGYYAPTSRYGTPDDFMALIDACHQAGIGVILDWVPGHFPKDSHGLYRFDGDACYEYGDPLMQSHEEWGTMVFDWGRPEVRSFLISNALFWLLVYHADGLRVDAVASMLYRDYGRKEGRWRPNVLGGTENLEAVTFLQDLNRAVLGACPHALMMAEESTAWPGVTLPPHEGGLGFNFKWNMGWMNDTLDYVKTDPLFRKGKHHQLTFSMAYAYAENFILSLSHDEVVHGKGSLLNKMPGSYDEKFAQLRTYFAYMMAHPGKKLVFMGGELAQFAEWDFEKELDWNLLSYDSHRKFRDYVKALNHFYLDHPEFWEKDSSWEGFSWIDPIDSGRGIYSFLRKDSGGRFLVCVFNFAPVAWENVWIGLPSSGWYKPVFNSDEERFFGSGRFFPALRARKVPCHGFEYSVVADLPPLSAVFLQL